MLVLDADHAPFRPFLRETVGLFASDPKLFLVQTPHVFLNPDPVERNLRTFGRMPSENEMFYSVTQCGLDRWNGSFFCGSAALLRRSALDSVGGFSGVTITEDCETALELHARGGTSAFVDSPLIAGLQPETFADFIGQRARWCQGMFQILLLKNPLTKPGLKPIQRLGYLSSMAYWFFPLPRLVFMLAPLLHIFFDVKLFVSSIDETIAFTATYAVATMAMQNYLYGRVRWPWMSELYEYVQGVHLVRSIAAVLVSPRKPSFAVTAKGGGLDEDGLSPLAWPFFAIFAALAAGCATALWRYLYEPGVTGLMLVVGSWCLFNLIVAGAALGVVAERRRGERCPSLAVSRRGRLVLGGESIAVAIERASAEGCLLRRADGRYWPASGEACGPLILLPQGDGEPIEGLRIRLSGVPDGATCTALFTATDAAAYRALAELIYADPAPLRDFLAGRRRGMDLFGGSLRVLGWGVCEPVRAAIWAVRDLRRSRTATPAAAPSHEVAGLGSALPAPAGQASAPVEALPVAAFLAPSLDRTMPAVAPSLTAESWREAVRTLAEEASSAGVPNPAPLDAPIWRAAVAALASDLAPVPELVPAPVETRFRQVA